MVTTRFPRCLLALLMALLLPACRDEGGDSSSAGRVVLYTSVDEPIARPILDEFTRRTGIAVDVQTDAEKNKSVGLARRLEAERDRPRADVWWGNEIFHTINLAAAGVLEPYQSPAAADIPPLFKDPQHLWAGSALRARVIAVADEEIAGRSILANNSILDLTDPRLKGRVAMAHPSAGTTSGHVAALYVLWGEEQARQYFRDLRANGVKLLGGNSVVAEKVADGTLLAGLTDNDDVEAALRQGGKLKLVLPDQETIGTLTIPCTVAMVKGARNPDAAKQLIDYLLSAEVERKLIEQKFARYSVRKGVGDETVKPMNVDYREVARVLKRASEEAVEILEGRSLGRE